MHLMPANYQLAYMKQRKTHLHEPIIQILQRSLVSKALMAGIMECATGMAKTLSSLSMMRKTKDITIMESLS